MNERPTVLLINPPSGLYRRDDRCQSRVEDQTVNVVFPPIELATYAAVARAAGWSAVIRDYPAMARARAMAADWPACRREIEALRPDALLVNTTSATAPADLDAARALRAVRPDALTIARGEYLRYSAGQFFVSEPALDAIAWGELEAILPALLHSFSSSSSPSFSSSSSSSSMPALPGVLFSPRWGKQQDLAVIESRPLVEDLDALPLPARDLLDNELYRSPETGNRLTVIQANRGCPSKCVFCPAGAMSGYRVRFRSPAGIVEELKECVERHGIREFLFNGDTFTIRKSWVIELCQRIVEARLDIRWGCNSRVDTIDDARAQWMKRAGCWVVAFGIESGSQALLDKMGKGARVEQAAEAVAVARRHGLLAHTFYIIGLPWETRQSLAETFALARRLDADFFDFNIAYPLPGTELWELARRDDLFEGPAPSESSYAQAALRTYELSGAELTAWRRRALLRLYLRPGYIARTLARIRSPRVLMNYLRAAAQRLRSLVQ